MKTIRTSDSELSVTGVDAELSVSGYDTKGIAGEKLGTTDIISLARGLTLIRVNDAEVPVQGDDWIFVIGSLDGKFEASGVLRLTGAATTFWKNGKLLNRTRWESLTTEWQLAVLGWLGGLLYGLSRLLVPTFARLGRDAPFDPDAR